MKNLVLSFLALGSFHGSIVTAIGGGSPQPCPPAKYEEITHRKKDQPAKPVSGRQIKGCDSGCEISFEDSYSVGVEVSVGADLGLSYSAASAGIGIAVAYSTTKGEAFTETIGCPSGATCMLLATNHMVEVSGRKVSPKTAFTSICPGKSEPYTMLLPEMVDTGNGKKSAHVTYEGCYWDVQSGADLKGYQYRACPNSPTANKIADILVKAIKPALRPAKKTSRSFGRRADGSRPNPRSFRVEKVAVAQ